MPLNEFVKASERTNDGDITHVIGLRNGAISAQPKLSFLENAFEIASGIKVFANGAALLAGTPDYAGQWQVALDGGVALPRAAATGHSEDGIVVLANPTTLQDILPKRIDANSTTQSITFAGGGHRFDCSGPYQDNTINVFNSSGGFAAVTLWKDGKPIFTFGTSGATNGGEYNRGYIAMNSLDGISDPLAFALYHEQPAYGTHRRLDFDYTAKTVTCYGLNTAGAVVNGLVADPIAWQVQANGAVAISSLAPANASSAGVAGTITWAAGFVYICVATNTWKRATLSTW